jgi:hypothetical protein
MRQSMLALIDKGVAEEAPATAAESMAVLAAELRSKHQLQPFPLKANQCRTKAFRAFPANLGSLTDSGSD